MIPDFRNTGVAAAIIAPFLSGMTCWGPLLTNSGRLAGHFAAKPLNRQPKFVSRQARRGHFIHVPARHAII
jgi:hypothetical protein